MKIVLVIIVIVAGLVWVNQKGTEQSEVAKEKREEHILKKQEEQIEKVREMEQEMRDIQRVDEGI
jgi:hypothetical protein